MTIGVFDSGIGGLTTLARLLSHAGFVDYLYYADTKNAPFGEKSEGEMKAILETAIKFFKEAGIETLVLACNSSSVIADKVNTQGLKLIPTLPPIFPFNNLQKCRDCEGQKIASNCIDGKQSIEKSTLATEKTQRYSCGGGQAKDEKTLLLATPFTVRMLHTGESLAGEKSNANDWYAKNVTAIGVQEFVPIIEKAAPDFKRAYGLLAKLLPPDDGYKRVVLGCTHYLYFKELVCERYKNAEIVDGSEEVLKAARQLKICGSERFPEVRFHFTGADKSHDYAKILGALIE